MRPYDHIEATYSTKLDGTKRMIKGFWLKRILYNAYRKLIEIQPVKE